MITWTVRSVATGPLSPFSSLSVITALIPLCSVRGSARIKNNATTEESQEESGASGVRQQAEVPQDLLPAAGGVLLWCWLWELSWCFDFRWTWTANLFSWRWLCQLTRYTIRICWPASLHLKVNNHVLITKPSIVCRDLDPHFLTSIFPFFLSRSYASWSLMRDRGQILRRAKFSGHAHSDNFCHSTPSPSQPPWTFVWTSFLAAPCPRL